MHQGTQGGAESPEMVSGPESSRTLTLSLAETERLILELGKLRASVQPAVPLELDSNAYFTGVTDPRWGVTASSEIGTAILRIRDPRYGWLHYSLPLSSAVKLSQALMEQATRAAIPGTGSQPAVSSSTPQDS
jgi:hypothetical protein